TLRFIPLYLLLSSNLLSQPYLLDLLYVFFSIHELVKIDFFMYLPYVVFSFPTSHHPPSSSMYYTPLRVPTYFQKQDSLILVFPYSKLIHHFCVFSLWTCPLCLAFFYFLRYIYSYNLRNLNTNWYMKDT